MKTNSVQVHNAVFTSVILFYNNNIFRYKTLRCCKLGVVEGMVGFRRFRQLHKYIQNNHV